MDVVVVGSGYVGTTVAACLADAGHHVTAVDTDETVVATLRDGRSPIHEPGLPDLIAAHAGDRLTASTAMDAVGSADVVLVTLPTPSDESGRVDTGAVEAGAAAIGDALADADDVPLVAVKSTVPPETVEETVAPILEERAGRPVPVAMNPEFLREGSAVADFRDPDRLVFGVHRDRDAALLRELYAPVAGDVPVVETTPHEAAMIKYANNAFLAAKVSLINDIGNVCKAYDVDAYAVSEALGLDDRIGARFLRSGLGWGGSCFPKDVAGLIAAARDRDYESPMLTAAVTVNDRQPERAVDRLARHLEIAGARVAVLGLAFKPGTDDVRNSRSIPLIRALDERGADVVACDPVAVENARGELPAVDLTDDPAVALEGADAAIVATAWPQFDGLDLSPMARRVVIDCRRVDIDRESCDVYDGLCW